MNILRVKIGYKNSYRLSKGEHKYITVQIKNCFNTHKGFYFKYIPYCKYEK